LLPESIELTNRPTSSNRLNVIELTDYLEERLMIVFEFRDGLTIRVQRTAAAAAADPGPLDLLLG
jgi:hypothetical protein